jgi:hypothetical protein
MNEVTLPCSLSIGEHEAELECRVFFSRTEDEVTIAKVVVNDNEVELPADLLKSLAGEILDLFETQGEFDDE